MATYTTGQMSGLEFELGNRRYEGDYTVTYTDESGAVLFEETSTRQGVVRSAEAAVGALVTVIVDTVRECEGFGIPAGHLYAALSGYVSLATFTDLVNLAVASGKIRRDGDILREVK